MQCIQHCSDEKTSSGERGSSLNSSVIFTGFERTGVWCSASSIARIKGRAPGSTFAAKASFPIRDFAERLLKRERVSVTFRNVFDFLTEACGQDTVLLAELMTAPRFTFIRVHCEAKGNEHFLSDL